MKRRIAAFCLCCLALALSAQTFSLSGQYGQSTQGGTKTATSSAAAAQARNRIISSANNADEGETAVGPALEGATDAPEGRVALAMTTPEYPVTPGDVYTLSFITANGAVISSIFVGEDYSVSLANIGKVDAAGLRFLELKRLVEKKVLEAYPLSSPQLLIKSCGTFPVSVSGEVEKSGIVYCWALTRLSALWEGVTAYASNRAVTIRKTSGVAASYDLFKVWRSGELSQDPYLRPQDTVVFGRYERSVSLAGEVRRPGTYQLLPGEGLKELIEVYGDGFGEHANLHRLTLVRYAPDSSGDNRGSMQAIDYGATPSATLANADTVVVPTAQELLPVVYFEGALGVGVNGEAPQAAQRLPFSFYPGETLSSAVQKLRAQFSAVSDLKNSYIQRGEERIAVDLHSFLYGKDLSGDKPLVAGDTIIVPFRQFFVSVSGAVKTPGRYPYVPDRGWEYYVNLAGGIDEAKNYREKLNIVDVSGAKQAKGRLIQPEDSIVVAQNSFLYYFGQVAPIITSIVSVATLVIAVLQ
jgi:protein involved in polysaccharide export with SLBB domain